MPAKMSDFFIDPEGPFARGSFGEVIVVQHLVTRKWYIMKRILLDKVTEKTTNEQLVKRLRQSENFQNESTIMQSIQGTHGILGLHWHFTHNSHVDEVCFDKGLLK